MSSPDIDPRVVLLHPDDNVLVCVRDLRLGEPVRIDGVAVTLSQDIALGHKIARRALRAGDKVLRYGAAIGSLTHDVAAGGHIHSHNLTSDYIPAHGRGGTQRGAT